MIEKNREVFALPTLLACRIKLWKVEIHKKQIYEKNQNLWANGKYWPVKND